MPAQEIQRFIDKISSSIPPFYTIFVGPNPVCGGQRRIRLRAFVGAGMLIKTVMPECGRILDIASAAHVPFTEMSGGVTGFLQHFGNGRCVYVQVVCLLSSAVASSVIQECSEIPFSREHARQDAWAGRATDGRCTVVLCILGSLRGKAVQMGRRHECAAKGTNVAETHIIRKDYDDVRLFLAIGYYVLGHKAQ